MKTDYKNDAERIYYEWDKALSSNDMDALLSLYAEDVIVESPLIPHLLENAVGICKGKQELRMLLDIVAERKPEIRKFYRTPFLQCGNLIMWEYPRESPKGEQMDFVEVMEINSEGLIQFHRVYWGWRGIQVMKADAYRQ